MKILMIAAAFLSAQLGAATEPSPALLKASADFSRIAEQANPWVVNIATTRIIRERYPSFWSDFFYQDMGTPGRVYRSQSLGSGFVLSSDGKILTNAHVIAAADEITVKLDNGEEYPAKVLGEDESVDLAVLSIAPKNPLTPASLGDSSKVKVGEWAIAIGNPLGFDHSVTVGIISATGRGNVFNEKGKYQNFLQTDASINHGNSGGPLCNIRGEVIGVNTAISTPNQGSIGLGFAIPINMVKRAVPDLIRAGRVLTPRLGFYTQDIDERLARALGLNGTRGVMVTDVAKDSPADKAGLKRGDVIQAVDQAAVPNSAALKTRLFEATPGQALNLQIWRKGKSSTLSLLGEASSSSAAWHGIEADANSVAAARAAGLATAAGIIVKRVLQNSSADSIGLKSGDAILEVNRQRIEGLSDWKKVSAGLDEQKDVVIYIVRGDSSAYVVLPGEK